MPEDSPVLQAAIGLADQIRPAGEEIEAGRRIPQPIAAAMKEAGILAMAMPRAWGGPELDPLTQIRIIEARHGRCRDDDRRGASRAWWLPRERAFSVCQRLPPLRMGGAGMHCF